MNYWELREQELQRKENAWLDSLNPFMRLMDNHIYFFIILALGCLFGFGLGLLIGLIL